MTDADTIHARAEAAGARMAVIALRCMLSMDLTVLNLALPALSADLRPSAAQLLWIADIYGFMVAGFLVTMGNRRVWRKNTPQPGGWWRAAHCGSAARQPPAAPVFGRRYAHSRYVTKAQVCA